MMLDLDFLYLFITLLLCSKTFHGLINSLQSQIKAPLLHFQNLPQKGLTILIQEHKP